jgi:hypothetical protein
LHLTVLKGYAHRDTSFRLAESLGTVIDALLARIKRDGLTTLISAQDEDGNTPLHYAVLHRDHALIKKLINAGADWSVENHDGKTPIDFIDIGYDDARKIIQEKVEPYTFKAEDEWNDPSLEAAIHREEALSHRQHRNETQDFLLRHWW